MIERARAAARQRADRQPSWVLLIELFIGLGWLRAAVSKVLAPAWWRGDVIREFVAAEEGGALPWWDPFLQGVVLEVPVAVAAAVVLGQLVAGAALLTGRWLGWGLTVGMTMNLAFVLTGAVDPSVFYLILQAAIALWLYETHTDVELGVRSLGRFAVAGVVVAVASAPFIRTLDPMRVVDDPATVLTTYALTIVVATTVARQRLRSGRSGLFEGTASQDRVVRETVVRGEVVPPRPGGPRRPDDRRG